MEQIGALLVDKPAGITSHDVVAKLRRALKQKRIGHTGTLDPFATGLLIICLGKATRLAQFLSGIDKEYEAVIRLGFSTDTQDYTGKPITPLISSDQLTIENLRVILAQFVGQQWQLPPMFSAKKVAGEALYRRARRGQVITRQAVEIVIYQIELALDMPLLTINPDGTRDFTIRVSCSAGTYVRTLAHDLGERLGCGAHLAQLRRVRIGKFSIAQAATLNSLVELATAGKIAECIITPAELVGDLPAVALSPAEIVRVGQGQAIAASDSGANGWVRLLSPAGTLVAMAEEQKNATGGCWQPRILMI
ncbi:MAG: tRNA pseudouridine(55) synthase TruB [Acidobacteriota bacterium]